MEEAFEGIIRFNSWLLALDILLIVAFLYEWYSHYKRTGSYIDYWHFNMFLVFFIPILIMYPFSGSTLNVLTVLGFDNLYVIQKYIDEAYTVTVVGFTSAYLGKLIFDKLSPVIEIEMLILPFSSTLGKFYYSVTTNKTVSRLFIFVYVLTLAAFVVFIVSAGLLGNPREFFMINRQYAPIYTLILNTFEIAFIVISTRTLQYNLKEDKILFITLILFGFFLGVRAPIFLRGLSFGVMYVLYKKKGYIPFFKVSLVIVGTLVLLLLFAYVRNSSRGGDISLDVAMQSFVPEIFYGNTFSDIRDFSWVLGYWNRERYWGLSYLAAILSFVPSSLYPIRATYGIGRITVLTAGLDPITHPGLRMGMFGEMYINFGIVAVIMFGIIWGYIMRRLDMLTKKYTSEGNVVKASSVLIYSGFISYFAGTAGFWGFYITVFLLTFLYLISRFRINK